MSSNSVALSLSSCPTHSGGTRSTSCPEPIPISGQKPFGVAIRLPSTCALFFPTMLLRTFPPGFIEPCLPSPGEQPPIGPDWVHEIKHDGYRLMARRDPVRVCSLQCCPLIIQGSSSKGVMS
jgi:hypothetical protein